MGGGVISMIIIVVVFFYRRAWGTSTYGKAARNVGGWGRDIHCGARAASDGWANRHGGWDGAVRGIETSLDEIFALWLCDKGL